MKQTSLRHAAILAMATLAAGVSWSAMATTMDTAGERSPWVASAQKLGPVADATPASITVYLSFKNEAELDTLIKAQTTRGSPEFGRYLTPAQFRARFAPDRQSVDTVRTFLQKQGFTIGRVATSGFYIEASGTVGQIKSTFQVDQNYYSFRGKTLRAPSKLPVMPAAFNGIVQHVAGLDDTGLLIQPTLASRDVAKNATPVAAAKPSAVIAPPTADFLESPFCSSYWGDTKATISPAADAAPYPATMSYLNCGYTPAQMELAYGEKQTKLTGATITVAIVDAYASPTLVYDSNRYFKEHGLPALTTANFAANIPDGIFNVSPNEVCGPQGWFTEQSLDVESVHTFAPGANILYVGARNCEDPLFDVLYDTIDTAAADIITNSWSEGGDFASADEQAVNNDEFKQAAAEGISVLFSSGDDGDLSQNNAVASGTWPADSPYATAVGGTTLALTSASGTKAEYGWGTYRAFVGGTVTISTDGSMVTATAPLGAFSFYAGAGGGLDFTQTQPSYQAGIVPASLSTVTYSATGEPIPFQSPRRVIPDIAMDADPYSGFLIGETFTTSSTPTYNGPCKAITSTTEYCEFGEGGTSLASPSFAGVLALVDQQRAANGLGPIGLVNPRLYGLAVGAPGSTTTPIIDVRAPASPVSLLRAYPAATGESPRVITVNSVPSTGCVTLVCEGVDDVFNYTAPRYDDVTGVGTPWVPVLVTALGNN